MFTPSSGGFVPAPTGPWGHLVPKGPATGRGGLRVGARVKSMFFDSDAILQYMKEEERRGLSAFGAAVRRHALASMPETPLYSASSAGSPPHTHARTVFREANKRRTAQGKKREKSQGFKGLRHLLFVYDPDERSVIAGPASVFERPTTIPEILEHGGFGIAERPFMQPAFEKAKTELPALWSGSVRVT